MMINECPGVTDLKTPTLTLKTCPQCGEEVEIFSNEMKVTCNTCGSIIYNDIVSCVQWCKHAKECVGDEMYRNLMQIDKS